MNDEKEWYVSEGRYGFMQRVDPFVVADMMSKCVMGTVDKDECLEFFETELCQLRDVVENRKLLFQGMVKS